MKVIPGQLLPNTHKSDGKSTYELNGKIYASYFGELTTESGVYQINVPMEPYHIVKKRRRDAVFVGNEWVKTNEFRIGDIAHLEGTVLTKMKAA